MTDQITLTRPDDWHLHVRDGEVLDAVVRVTNHTFDRHLVPRRAGDPGELVSDPSRIRSVLPWQPQYADLDDIITHALQWERKLSDLRGK